MHLIILAIAISYLIGSIPTAYILGLVLKGIDIRKFGSGNVGATNALRTLGKTAGVTVLILDMLKGFIAVVFLADIFSSEIAAMPAQTLRLLLGVSCIFGHTWTVFLKFKGGKGVATTFGALLGLAARVSGLKFVVGLVILTWLLVFIPIRIVSLASIISIIAMPMYMLLFKQSPLLISSSIALGSIIIWRHRANIKRILQGKEPRLK